MKIKLLHAHFLISLGDYSNERVGFTAELEEGDTVKSVVADLRSEATAAIGAKAEQLYDRRQALQQTCDVLERKLTKLRTEWEATAEFLKAQGIKPDAPSMPQFKNLISAVKTESESVLAEIVEEPGPDQIPFDSGVANSDPDNFN
ncbi:hypothetical protein [Calothrix sp. PCC 7507]|uniref:hypothetical protein n=1 Tax=Calothrix sp. PCC 7507 TaxID=99598 RepID=UPI00029EF61C|nr:hypothetical protein [Calothrix sp. PCC 7507]AFY34887.1 hypothetical protein Cal7507_4518 [Calothrix sp. PCC 7507]